MKKENQQTAYEMVLVFEPRFDDGEPLQQEMEKIRTLLKASGANILKEDLWGKRPLAYPMRKFTNGVYVVLVFEATGDTVQVVERQLRITDSLLRFLTVLKDKYTPDFHAGLRYEREYRSPRPSHGSSRPSRSDSSDSDNSGDDATA